MWFGISETRDLCLMKCSFKISHNNFWNKKSSSYDIYIVFILYFPPNECPGLCRHFFPILAYTLDLQGAIK